MNIEYIKNKMQKTHVIKQLGDVDKLYDLAKNRDTKARGKLSCIITSVLETELSSRESELVADVLIKLTRQAEKDLRKAISRQIALLDNAPLRLVLQLANDDIEIAKPVLTKSSVLGDLDLMYIIKSKTSEYWQAIAAREVLNGQVIDVLADTGDFDTALVLAENENIELTQYAVAALADIAQDHEVLAMPLLRREEVSSDIATCLYEYVGEEVKNFIIKNYNIDKKEVSKIVDGAVDEFIVDPKGEENGFLPDGDMLIVARRLKDRGALNVSSMLSTLRLGHIRSFVAQISVYTDIPAEDMCEILSHPKGKKLAVVARAFDIKKQDFISMFLLSSKIWNDGRVVDIEEIKAATANYNKVTPDCAMKIIRANVKK